MQSLMSLELATASFGSVSRSMPAQSLGILSVQCCSGDLSIIRTAASSQPLSGCQTTEGI